MSDGDSVKDEPDDFHDRLDTIDTELEAAGTESALDEIESKLDTLMEAVEEATFPDSPETDDEDDQSPDPKDELAERIDDARERLEEQRGPYASDVVSDVASARATIESTEWAEEGVVELADAVSSFGAEVDEILEQPLDILAEDTLDGYIARLKTAEEVVEAAELDADADAETISSLLPPAGALTTAVDNATAFGDLPVREQLNRRGFFDILGHYKDYPPEWSAIKAHEAEGNVEMILLAFDLLDSNFMEDHCIDSLRRLGDERALDPMMGLAKRRNKPAIEVLGKIASEEPVDMLLDYIDTDSDPALQQVSLRALGEIGAESATEAVAQQLAADDDRVRSSAARALGMIGDPRAVSPLTNVLETDAADPVRGSAAWALVQIGTGEAITALEPFAEDRSVLVEAEAVKITAN